MISKYRASKALPNLVLLVTLTSQVSNQMQCELAIYCQGYLIDLTCYQLETPSELVSILLRHLANLAHPFNPTTYADQSVQLSQGEQLVILLPDSMTSIYDSLASELAAASIQLVDSQVFAKQLLVRPVKDKSLSWFSILKVTKYQQLYYQGKQLSIKAIQWWYIKHKVLSLASSSITSWFLIGFICIQLSILFHAYPVKTLFAQAPAEEHFNPRQLGTQQTLIAAYAEFNQSKPVDYDKNLAQYAEGLSILALLPGSFETIHWQSDSQTYRIKAKLALDSYQFSELMYEWENIKQLLETYGRLEVVESPLDKIHQGQLLSQTHSNTTRWVYYHLKWSLATQLALKDSNHGR